MPMPDTLWKTVWTASMQGPYPVGNAYAQPDLSFAFPDAETGARNQTFRMLVRPDRWGRRCRLRFSNMFGRAPVTLDGVYAGLHLAGGAVVPGTNLRVSFGGAETVVIPPGESAWSDPVSVPFYSKANENMLDGRKLAASFHVVGASGPMTWHAKAIATSYVSSPDAGSCGGEEGEEAFPFATTSWFFLDAVDVETPAESVLVAAFGDSITEGMNATLNGDDRWPDVLSRRLRNMGYTNTIIVNAGIGGNEVTGPAAYSAENPYRGGPAAADRIERDVFGLTGVDVVLWLQGINDLRRPEVSAEQIWERMVFAAEQARRTHPSVRLVVATVPTCLGCELDGHGTKEQDDKRKRLNSFIKENKVFDAWMDFDTPTAAREGGLCPEFAAAALGGAGDRLHPNRAGYMAIAAAVDPHTLLGDKSGRKN